MALKTTPHEHGQATHYLQQPYGLINNFCESSCTCVEKHGMGVGKKGASNEPDFFEGIVFPFANVAARSGWLDLRYSYTRTAVSSAFFGAGAYTQDKLQHH